MAHTAVYVSVSSLEGEEVASALLLNCMTSDVAENIIEEMNKGNYNWCIGAAALVKAFKTFYGNNHTIVFMKKEGI